LASITSNRNHIFRKHYLEYRADADFANNFRSELQYEWARHGLHIILPEMSPTGAQQGATTNSATATHQQRAPPATALILDGTSQGLLDEGVRSKVNIGSCLIQGENMCVLKQGPAMPNPSNIAEHPEPLRPDLIYAAPYQ
jgi:hypothetical protein